MTEGIDAYNPDVVEADLVFTKLTNVEPRLGRLFATKGLEIFQNLTLATGDVIVDFGYYSLPNRKFTNFYAFSKKNVYMFNFETELFETTPIYTAFTDNAYPYVIIPWYDALYVTKKLSPLVKIQRGVVTVVADGFSARYGVIANSHLYFGGIGDIFDDYLARLRWSDLDAPDSLVIDPSQSEADFFDLEPDSREITGISYQRGSPLSYCEDGIWVGRAIGFPGGFRHEPLIPGVGNIFHHALVRNKEIDFFIGKDNFYALNGLQLQPIGDGIFQRFIANVQTDETQYVRGYIDSRKMQVFWVYKDLAGDLQSVVYNYKEKKWSERDPQGITAWFDSPRTVFRGYKTIDEYDSVVDDIINDQTALIDDPDYGFPVVLPQLAGGPNVDGDSVVAKATDAIAKLDESEFDHVIETNDFYFRTVGEVNEITKALIEFVGDADANITMKVGSRSNQSQSITWSTAIPLDNTTNDNLAFYFRRFGAGRYLRFKFEWNNSVAGGSIDELRLLSLIEVKEDANTAEE